jgi:SAM-dependent MidA family methyltransferase
VTQGDFLLALGLEMRLDRLKKSVTSSGRDTLTSGARRLIAPEEMGTLFKVLAATGPDQPTPPGFDMTGQNSGLNV